MYIKGRRSTWSRAAVPAGLALLFLGASVTTVSAQTVLSQQWHLNAMKAEEMWQVSTGKGVTVAVIDTGVREVPELAGQVLPGKDFTDGVSGKNEDHGTTTAAVIAGTGKGRGGKESAYGLAPGAKILPLKVSDGSETSDYDTRSVVINGDLAPAIRYAADSEARIISVSVTADEGSVEVKKAVDYALSKGKLVFAPVGDPESVGMPVQYPARTPGVVGVAAIDKDLKSLKTAAVGADVELSAPGVNVLSACAEKSGRCESTGTPVAAAVVAASAALIWAEHPDWTNYQVLRVMVDTVGAPTSGAVRNNYIGYGVVRPRIALKSPGDPGPADTYPLPDRSAPPSQPDRASAGAPGSSTASTAGAGHSTAFLIALSVSVAGLLCLGVAGPLLLADRRRMRLGLSRP